MNAPTVANCLCLVSLCLPSSIARACLGVSLLLFLVTYYTSVIRSFDIKVVLSLFFLPGLVIATYHLIEDPVVYDELLRYLMPLVILSLYPYSSEQIDSQILQNCILIIVVFLSVFQIGTVLGIGTFDFLRDTYYPYSGVTNVFAEKKVSTILVGYGDTRAGGIFHNPNVMGANIFFLYLTYVASLRDDQSRLRDKIIVCIVLLSIYLTGSRTYTVAIIPVLFCTTLFLNNSDSPKQQVVHYGRFAMIFIAILGGGILAYQASSRLQQGFEVSGSFTVKFEILRQFLTEAVESQDYIALIFGARHDVFFDQDFGYWLGAGGIFAVIGVFGLYILIFYKQGRRRFFYAIILASCGNSLLYALPLAPYILVLACVLGNKVSLVQREFHINSN